MAQQPDSVLERRFVVKGTTIIHEGEAGNTAFLIQSGVVRVFMTAEQTGQTVELARLAAGQIFGEMALVVDEKRTASVEAVEDTSLILITRQMVDDKLRKSDPTIRALVPMLMNRLQQTNNAMLNRNSDIQNLIDCGPAIYNAVRAGLPRPQQMTFERGVLPKLDEFLTAVRLFVEKYSEK